MSDVLDVTSNHQVVEVQYHNYKNGGREMTFTLHPYYVKQFNNRWFLFGLDDKYRNIDTLALDRIVNLKVVEGVQFVPNTDISFEHYFDDVVGVTIPSKEIEKEHIVLQFTKGRFPYVSSKPIHHSQEIVSEEDCMVSIDVRPNNELVTQILSFGPDVEVLEPQSFREQIISKIQEYNKKYSLL